MDNDVKECQCKYRFWRWLIKTALKNKKVYWLLWGVLVILAICAWRFGLVGIL